MVFIDPEGYSCFSINQISWIKIKKVFFVNKRRHLKFVYTSIDSVSGTIFYDFRENSVRNFFYRPVNTSQILSLSWYLLVQLLHLPLKFIFRNCRETRSHFESLPKTVNIQGYSVLQQPFRTRENCYPLIGEY